VSNNQTIPRLTRRSFIRGGAAFGGMIATGTPLHRAFAANPFIKIDTRTIEVNKKAAKVFRVLGADGKSGIFAKQGDRFAGSVLNASGEPLQLHWHGQVKAPFDQDRARPGGGACAVDQSDTYDFELTPGTHWMHSHTLSEQQMLAAPMITRENDAGDVQDVVVMLHDFAFRSPLEILAELGGTNAHAGHGAAQSSAPMQHGAAPMLHGAGSHMMPGQGSANASGGHMMGGGGMGMGMIHANDVRYDAYLANDRTFDDPDTVKVEKSGRVRLRIINAGTATAFFISTPGLVSRAIAVDGMPCQPAQAGSYPIAQGQRIDLLVEIPKGGGAFPVLAQVEDRQYVTGIVLATPGAAITKLSASLDKKQGMLDLSFETALKAANPLAEKRPDKSFAVMLGEEPGYRWTINGRIHGEHQPFEVKQGERVEMTFMNPTMMMHPMHLHGHHFQVVAVGGRRFSGAVRDTMIVPAHAPVTIAFDANLKGSWFLHCHHLYHMATGMMTEVRVV
jgi:FtsP/CotA-like multicopper oxidase with cupredoxin domain